MGRAISGAGAAQTAPQAAVSLMPAAGDDILELQRLARDRSREGRGKLAAAIADLYGGTERVLTATDRELMTAIILQLLNGIELSVRAALAERFARQPDAPHDLVVALARDEIGVAYPLLVNSDVLQDPDLIEIVQQRTMEHQLAIAARRAISEPVSDALAATRNPRVIVRLLGNPGARIPPATLERLIDEAGRTREYQQALVERGDLPPALVRKLYWTVSAALRLHLVGRLGVEAGTLDDAIEASVHNLLGETGEAAAREARARAGDNPGPALLALLRAGQVTDFVDAFARLSRLRPVLVRRFVFEPGGEALATLCKALGIAKEDFVSLFLFCRQGRLGDKTVDASEVRNALGFFDKLDFNSARGMLQHWQRDPDYLAALWRLESKKNQGRLPS